MLRQLLVTLLTLLQQAHKSQTSCHIKVMSSFYVAAVRHLLGFVQARHLSMACHHRRHPTRHRLVHDIEHGRPLSICSSTKVSELVSEQWLSYSISPSTCIIIHIYFNTIYIFVGTCILTHAHTCTHTCTYMHTRVYTHTDLRHPCPPGGCYHQPCHIELIKHEVAFCPSCCLNQ